MMSLVAKVKKNLSQEHEQLIKEFLLQWWLGLQQELARTTARISLPSLHPDDLYEQELGKKLQRIVLAAEGQLERSCETTEEISMAIFDLLEMLWSRPGCSELVDPPLSFWTGQFGYMVLQADLWASDDRLITMKEAATLLGVSLQSLRGSINFGVLSEYRDIHEANPRRATRLRLSEVMQLVQGRKSAGGHYV